MQFGSHVSRRRAMQNMELHEIPPLQFLSFRRSWFNHQFQSLTVQELEVSGTGSYGVTMDLQKSLSSIVGSQAVLQDPDSLQEYGRDWTRYYTPTPKAVVFPQNTEQVIQLVKWANSERVALVPSGGRTGLSGAAVAKNGEVVVSFAKMNRVLDFNPTDMTITVEPGVITEELQRTVAEKGFYFPVDFAARGSSQIGGNVATNAGGIKVVRYGLMRDWIASLEVVTAQGDHLKLNNSLIKNATGYDLRHLFIGSEGTLGFITQITLKYTHPPKPLSVMVLGVSNTESVMKVFESFRKNTSLMAFELFTDKALKVVLEGHSELSAPFETQAPLYLLVEYEQVDTGSDDRAIQCFEECVEKGWVMDGVLSQSETQSKNFWALRELISEACSRYTPYKNDVSVKISKVPEFMAAVDKTMTNSYPDLTVVWFGHIGDGNLHINILKPKDLPMPEFVKRCQDVDKMLFQHIQNFNGSVSAEHGVGLSKKPFLHFTRSPEEILYMKAIKKVFDPNNIMNPGKIFDL